MLDDQALPLAFKAAKAMNDFLRGIYFEEAFIQAKAAAKLANFFLGFLRFHGEAIALDFGTGRTLFLQMPNLNQLQHIGIELRDQSQTVKFCVNPLLFSSQMDEDFIGRPLRLSRRVHASIPLS